MPLNLLLAVVSGLLLVLIHPRFDLSFLAPFALTPLLIALGRERRPVYRFLLGYVAGAVFWGCMCYWIQYVLAVHGGLGDAGGTAVFGLFCLTPSLNMAFFGLCAGIVIHRANAVPVLAALWVACERIPTPFNFMWLKLGDAATDMDLLARLAPFTGVYGLSFILALMSAGLAVVVMRRPRKEAAWLALALLCFAFPELPPSQVPADYAVSVQPVVPEEKDDWTRADVDALDQQMANLSLAPATMPPSPKLILWPEAPAPLYFFDDPSVRDTVVRVAQREHASVLMSTVGRTPGNQPLNSAVMVTPDGAIAGRYDKMYLVPFGEFVPEPFGFANKITKEIGDFVPGERITVMPGGVGVFICYESAFPHLVRENVTKGATVLANLSNDGYFGHSAAREQHLQLVRMRAIENRRWILRSTNNGITASINPSGRIFNTLPPYVVTSGRLPFSYESSMTFYSRYGDCFAWICVLIGIVGLLFSQRPHYRKEGWPGRKRPRKSGIVNVQPVSS